MDSRIATALVGGAIALLFALNRDRETRTSKALWIPVVWLSLCASRTVAQWLGINPFPETSEELLEGSPVDAFSYFMLLFAGLAVLATRRERVAAFLRANGPLVLFLMYCAVSTLWSDYPFVAFKRWTKELGDLVMIMIVLTDGDPAAALKRLLARAGFVLIPVSILLIKFYPLLGRIYSPWTGTAYNIGVATGKNGLGYVCLLFGLGSVWRLLLAFRAEEGTHRTRTLAAHGAVLALTLWLFYMADSATSLVCFLLGSTLLAVASHRAIVRQPAIVHTLVFLLLSVIVYGLFLDPGAGLVEMAGRDSTLTGRTALWSQVLRMTVDPLFGAGYESFWLGDRVEELWRTNWWHPNQAHNGYLEIFLDLGWAGVALVGVVMMWGYRNVARAIRADWESASLRLAYFFVAATYNLTEHAFRQLHPVWLALLLAVAVVPEQPVEEVQEIGARFHRPPTRADLLVAEAWKREVDL